MAESNWALAVNGASVVDVSGEAAHVASGAANLLHESEERLWIAGDAPQQVTLQLDASHPPLNFAGWHVWHDYLTNPKKVEIASGTTLLALSPVLVCQALPGAGTQVWKLPHPVPANHRIVRFTILETFGPGPTYMNNVVLLADDPGPEGEGETSSTPPTDVSVRVPSVRGGEQGLRSSGARGGASNNQSLSSLPAGSGGVQTPRAATSIPVDARALHQHYGSGTSLTYASSPSVSPHAARRDPNVSDPAVADSTLGPDEAVGVLYRSSRGAGAASTPRGYPATPPGAAVSSARMSQMLKDLDEDIRSLRPIKSASPASTNMLMYAPPGTPTRCGSRGNVEEATSSTSSNDRRRGSRRDSRDRHSRRRRSVSRHSQREESKAHGDVGGPTAPQTSTGAAQAPPAAPLPPQGWPMLSVACSPAAFYPQYTIASADGRPHAFPNGAADASGTDTRARISALEQAVASLTQTVQHQREDLTMMKRILLQQATERRHEAAERRRKVEEDEAARAKEAAHRQQLLSSGRGVNGGLTTDLILAAADTHSLLGPINTAAAREDFRLTHRKVDVQFPEDALRAFVQSAVEERMKKHLRRSEAKVLSRLDNYLHEVVQSIVEGVDERVRWHLDRPTAGGTQHANGSARANTASARQAHAAPQTDPLASLRATAGPSDLSRTSGYAQAYGVRPAASTTYGMADHSSMTRGLASSRGA